MNTELNFLVVEDDPVDANAVSRLLDRRASSPHTDNATSLEQAKQKIRSTRYDAVILDLGLPDSQGVDGVIEFQATAPELPIVVLTGNTDENTALRIMDIGAEDFLSKNSMTEESLWRSLRYAIERHRRKREVYHDNAALRVSLTDALQQASTDSLTSLPNRRGLDYYLDQLVKAHPHHPIIVGITDLDHFKEINDEHGHNSGDSVLREFAVRLQHCMRNGDFVARVGGDEFVVVFGGVNRVEAEALGRRMLDHVASNPISIGKQSISFSATLALAELEPSYLDLEQILMQTHAMLIRGKEAGRNRVECAWTQSTGTADNAPGDIPSRRKTEEPLADIVLSQHARAVRPFLKRHPMSYHLIFGLGPESWPLVSPAVSRARLVNRLSQMTLHCMRRAQAWRQAKNPDACLHLDLEADAVKPWFCMELLHIFKHEKDRNNCVLFLHTDFHDQPGAASWTDLRLLRRAGFQIGVRNVGDGSTILENLQLLSPEWIRLDPALTINVGRYEKKAEALRQMMAMLRPLGAQLVADETEIEDDLKILKEMGFSAYCTEYGSRQDSEPAISLKPQ